MDIGDITNRKTQAMQKIGVAFRVQLLEYAVACGWQEGHLRSANRDANTTSLRDAFA